MNKQTIENLKIKLSKLAQLIASTQSSDSELFVYDDQNLDSVFKDYENIKGTIKNILKDKSFLADRHKISAFFIGSIIKNKPIKIKLNKTDIEDSEVEFVVNMNLSISFAKYILKSFYKKLYDKELNLIMPISDGDKAYIDQLIGLIKILTDTLDDDDKKVLLLSVSHILFLLEKYSEERS